MYINSLGMREINAQTVKNTNERAGSVGSYDYDTVMQKALEKRSAAVEAASREGDMVITQPASYSYRSTASRNSLTSQEKNEMSLEEYRQWFRNEVSAIQSENVLRSPYLSDTLIIKEEAFEKMKNEPEWEREVLDKIRTHCKGQELAGTKAVGYQIIGASPESCHEEGIPVRTTVYPAVSSVSPYAALSYGYPYASALYASPLLTPGGYWNSMLSGQTGLSGYLTQGLLGGQNSFGMLSSAAYRNVMNGGVETSLLGNFFT